MSAIHSDATSRIACPCAGCFAYSSFAASTSENISPGSRFEKPLSAERPMVSFNPTPIGFQPALVRPYASMGLISAQQHGRFASPFPFPRFPAEESAFGNIATDLTRQNATPSRQQVEPRVFWNSVARAPERPRRVRTVFSPPQLQHLEKEFKVQQYIGSAQRIYIASQLGLTETQVKVWFQNRRIRWRKQNLTSVSTHYTSPEK